VAKSSQEAIVRPLAASVNLLADLFGMIVRLRAELIIISGFLSRVGLLMNGMVRQIFLTVFLFMVG
jgi:hypothetical protein